MSTRNAAPVDTARSGVEDNPRHGLSESKRPASEIRHLSAQNERLLQGVDSLLRLHEREQAQYQAFQTTLERLVEQFRLSTATPAPAALVDEVRRGVSDDLKPLLHAIIDLLELSIGQVSPNPEPTPEAKPTVAHIASARGGDAWLGEGASTRPMPSDDLPKALPEILTKSVEELISKSGARRPAGGDKTGAGGRKARVPIDSPRAGAWITVTSDPLKT